MRRAPVKTWGMKRLSVGATVRETMKLRAATMTVRARSNGRRPALIPLVTAPMWAPPIYRLTAPR